MAEHLQTAADQPAPRPFGVGPTDGDTGTLTQTPLPAGGGPLDLVTTIGFLGRTTASTTTTLLRADGKLAVQLDLTHLVRPGERIEM